MTTRQKLWLAGFSVFFIGLGLVAFGSLSQQVIGVFVIVVGLLTALSSNFKGARKEIHKAFKTFMNSVRGD